MSLEVPPRATQALRLAVRLETGRIALRCIVADHRTRAPLETSRSAFTSVRELASQLPALWVDWGRVAVAVAEFHRARIGSRAAELQRTLFAVEQRGEVLAQLAVRWALFDQWQASLPMNVANAFIDWDSARKVLHEQRQAVTRQYFGSLGGDTGSSAAELHETCARCEIHSATLLLKAVGALDRAEPGDG